MSRTILALVAALVLAAPAQAASPADVLATNVDLVSADGTFACSGIVVKQAPETTFVLSAAHCEEHVQAVQVTVYDDEGEVVALERVYFELVASDSWADLLLVKTRRPVPGIAATFDPAVRLAAGDEVWAATSPHGLSKSFAKGTVQNPRAIVPTFRKRWVTQVAIAGVLPGSSGGGLFLPDGRLVGVTSFGAKVGGMLFFVTPADVERFAGWRVWGR